MCFEEDIDKTRFFFADSKIVSEMLIFVAAITSAVFHCALGSGLPAWRRLSYRSRRLRDDNRRMEGGNYSTPLFPSEHYNHLQIWTSTWCLKIVNQITPTTINGNFEIFPLYQLSFMLSVIFLFYLKIVTFNFMLFICFTILCFSFVSILCFSFTEFYLC